MDNPRRGFTLVEMLVVIGITTLFAAMAIGYSHVGQNEDALTIETAKISELMLQARQLAIATYAGPGNACAYGVSFNYGAGSGERGTYSLFAYQPVPTTSRCPSLASTTALGLGNGQSYEEQYQGNSWNALPTEGVKLLSPSQAGEAPQCKDPASIVYAIMFYPPDPDLLVSYDGTHFTAVQPTSYVCLATVDGENSSVITINPEGQINF